MKILIRKAAKQDCESIMKLVHELAVYERAGDEVTVSHEHFMESGFGKNPVWEAFVAEQEGVVVGFALYYIRYSTWKGQRMYLEDLVVTDAMRGKGIGKLLFDSLIQQPFFILFSNKPIYKSGTNSFFTIINSWCHKDFSGFI